MLSLWDHRVNIKFNIRYRTLSALSASSVVCPLCCLCLPYLLTLSAPLPLSTLSAGSVCHSISVCPLCWPCLPSLLALSSLSAGSVYPLCWPCMHPLCWPCLLSLLALCAPLSLSVLSAGPVCSICWPCLPLCLCLPAGGMSGIPPLSLWSLLGRFIRHSSLDLPSQKSRKLGKSWGGGGGDRPARSSDM